MHPFNAMSITIYERNSIFICHTHIYSGNVKISAVMIYRGCCKLELRFIIYWKFNSFSDIIGERFSFAFIGSRFRPNYIIILYLLCRTYMIFSLFIAGGVIRWEPMIRNPCWNQLIDRRKRGRGIKMWRPTCLWRFRMNDRTRITLDPTVSALPFSRIDCITIEKSLDRENDGQFAGKELRPTSLEYSAPISGLRPKSIAS